MSKIEKYLATQMRGDSRKNREFGLRKGGEIKELRAVSAINYGYTESASSEPIGPHFLRITDIQNERVDWGSVPYCKIESTELPKYDLASGDIVFARTGATTGKSFLVVDPPKAVFASYLIRLRLLEKKLLPEFISFFFQTESYWKLIKEGSSGSAQGGFNATKLGALSLPVPPLPEQHRIVAILDEAFVGIAAAKANIEKNLQNTREFFEGSLNAAISGDLTHDWRLMHSETAFVSDDFRQALVKRKKQWKSVSSYKGPQPAALGSPLSIPASWTVASPEQLSIKIVDCLHSTPIWTEAGVVCLRTTNFGLGFLNLEKVGFVSVETYKDRISRLEPKAGDVLYSREGGILGIACIFPEGLKACLGQRMMQFRLNTSLILPEFFTYVLNSQMIISVVTGLTGGAAAPHLNIRDIKTFTIPLPPISEQEEIVCRLESISTETRRLESIYQQKLSAFDELKKSLLDQAFSGRL